MQVPFPFLWKFRRFFSSGAKIMSADLFRNMRLSFLQIDDNTRAALREFRPVLGQHIDTLLGDFYAHLGRFPEAVAVFKGGSAAMDHARRIQRTHWLDNVFGGAFDDSYFAQAVKIGQVHEKVGLEPRWYLAGYSFTLARIQALVISTYRKRPDRAAEVNAAIVKALFLDMDLAISIYIEASKASAARLLNQHADDFERNVSGMVQIVASASTELESSAQVMSGTADETARQASSVAGAAEQASSNVQTVAAATEELSASIHEISRQVNQSTQIAGSAVEEAERTNSIIQGLAEAAGKIGEVVKLINNIASQTNLLALNATIEAARAGEAGKGFAVVAGEVKSLANQTAKATDEISGQIMAVQNATRNAVGAIHEIGNTIGKMNEIASAIAAAVEEQGAATKEIARNVQEAAYGTGTVTQNIASVTQAAGETGHASREMLSATGELSRQAQQLSGQVHHFLSKIRTAS